MNKKLFFDCKKLLKKFIDRGYFKSFNSGDIFYFVRKNSADSMFTFVETMIDDSFVGQLFMGPESFNYVHDILTSNSTGVTIYDCNAILFSLKTKNEMTDFDKTYYHDNNMRVMEELNLVIYRYYPGKRIQMANDLEITELYKHLSYLNSIIEAEFDRIIDAFSKELCVYSIIDDENYTYEMILRPLPYLETKSRLNKVNNEFVLEFKNMDFQNSECYLFLSYMPLVIKEKNIRPLMIYLYYPNLNKHLFKYMTEPFNKNKNMLYGILDEAFNEYGKPYKMYINNRYAYAYLHKTLNELNIENEFLREEKKTDENIGLLMSSLYSSTNLDEIIEEETFVSNLMDVISSTINILNDENKDDEDLTPKEELIS